MRSFVAIELPEAIRRQLGERVAELRRELPPARWVASENLHLTLQFLGEVSASQEAALTARLTDVFRRAAAFDLRLEGAGWFPPRRPARVAWIGIESVPALDQLRTGVTRVCRAELGLEEDRRLFRPHLTVARCRRPWPRAAAARWRDGWSGRLGQGFAVRQGVLMESRLSSAGASYRPRAVMPLGEGT